MVPVAQSTCVWEESITSKLYDHSNRVTIPSVGAENSLSGTSLSFVVVFLLQVGLDLSYLDFEFIQELASNADSRASEFHMFRFIYKWCQGEISF